ncbi:MAG: copper chaperone PCu(A)C [Agarilytica sp.]
MQNVVRKLISLLVFMLVSTGAVSSPWGANYFPNTELTTHEGEKVRFFDDLIEGKIVAINFIYTTCPDVCPLETAQLTRVQKIMGDRIGKDIHFYSITIDPENDTPERLKEYRGRFGAKWTFLTGDKNEIIELRRKLGLYIEGADDGPNKNNHNVSMIIGNQKTGRWMKRSPFENAHVLADQLGNWLDDWRSPQKKKSYADAPELRSMGRGEPLFRTRCASCHSVDGIEEVDDIGPDLAGVTKRREKSWLIRWLQAPDKMIAEKDPIALAMLKKYNDLPMPNLRLNKQEAMDLLAYLDTLPTPETEAATKTASKKLPEPTKSQPDTVAVMNAWVREAHPNADVNAGYMTLINAGSENVTIVSANSAAFEKVEFHEMAVDDGMMQMRELKSIDIPVSGQVQFVPGGKHLMLKTPKRRVKDGDIVSVELIFSNGMSQVLNLGVKKDF